MRDHLHDDVLHRHEGKLLLELGPDHGRIRHQAVSDIVEADQDRIGQQEHLRDVDPANRAVVESALEPLVGICFVEVRHEILQFAAKGADAFGSMPPKLRLETVILDGPL